MRAAIKRWRSVNGSVESASAKRAVRSTSAIRLDIVYSALL
ncbi:unnamed protein product [Nippostrongylus brasiliensis]|uniref:Transposase n=1 Tax=Nippostrongylus brasiliensis TaxID=27835 RepID=A0A0N4YPL5_NIPBR|nr:unnamed protein product [Nippostrongylus brasiliensis]